MASIVKKPAGGSTGRSYLNTQFGTQAKGIFGPHGRTPGLRIGGNPRAGMSYSVGLDSKGRVVHIYRDGERIVMHTHAAHAAPPHPASFGGMAAPSDTNYAAAVDQSNQDVANLQHNLAAQMAASQRPKGDPALTQQHAQALQAALAAMSQSGA